MSAVETQTNIFDPLHGLTSLSNGGCVFLIDAHTRDFAHTVFDGLSDLLVVHDQVFSGHL